MSFMTILHDGTCPLSTHFCEPYCYQNPLEQLLFVLTIESTNHDV